MPSNFNALIPTLIQIVRQAGEVIKPYFRGESLDVMKKSDATPLTKADLAAHDIINTELEKLEKWPVLSEEGELPPFEYRQQWERYWLIDPLDGTRGFISGVDEFTVNIALIEQHQPVIGVLYAPMYDKLYYASKGEGAFLIENNAAPRAIETADQPFEQLRFVVGKYHRLRRLQPLMDAIPGASLLRLNSSLKFVTIAEGLADVYIRLGPICEWDTAAGHCILEEAGGKVVDFSGHNLQYNARKSLLSKPFLAVGNRSNIEPLIELFEREASK